MPACYANHSTWNGQNARNHTSLLRLAGRVRGPSRISTRVAMGDVAKADVTRTSRRAAPASGSARPRHKTSSTASKSNDRPTGRGLVGAGASCDRTKEAPMASRQGRNSNSPRLQPWVTGLIAISPGKGDTTMPHSHAERLIHVFFSTIYQRPILDDDRRLN